MKTSMMKNKISKLPPASSLPLKHNHNINIQSSNNSRDQQVSLNRYLVETPQRSAKAQNKQLKIDVESFVHIFTSHFMQVQTYFKKIDYQLTKIQAKIAFCFGKYNQIQWKISKSLCQIEQSKILNKSLLQTNRQVQIKLQQIQKDYDELRNRKYISNLQKRLEQLKDSVHKMQIQNYKVKFSKQKVNQFEENIDRLEVLLSNKASSSRQLHDEKGIFFKVIQNLIDFLKQKGDVNQWLQDRIKENIEMKCRIIRLEVNRQYSVHND